MGAEQMLEDKGTSIVNQTWLYRHWDVLDVTSVTPRVDMMATANQQPRDENGRFVRNPGPSMPGPHDSIEEALFGSIRSRTRFPAYSSFHSRILSDKTSISFLSETNSRLQKQLKTFCHKLTSSGCLTSYVSPSSASSYIQDTVSTITSSSSSDDPADLDNVLGGYGTLRLHIFKAEDWEKPDEDEVPMSYFNWHLNDQAVLKMADEHSTAFGLYEALHIRHTNRGAVAQVKTLDEALDINNSLANATTASPFTSDDIAARILSETITPTHKKMETVNVAAVVDSTSSTAKPKVGRGCNNCMTKGFTVAYHTDEYCTRQGGGMEGKTVEEAKVKRLADKEAKKPKAPSAHIATEEGHVSLVTYPLETIFDSRVSSIMSDIEKSEYEILLAVQGDLDKMPQVNWRVEQVAMSDLVFEATVPEAIDTSKPTVSTEKKPRVLHSAMKQATGSSSNSETPKLTGTKKQLRVLRRRDVVEKRETTAVGQSASAGRREKTAELDRKVTVEEIADIGPWATANHDPTKSIDIAEVKTKAVYSPSSHSKSFNIAEVTTEAVLKTADVASKATADSIDIKSFNIAEHCRGHVLDR
ncbi:hypothetical protein C8J56DRAFT_890427 [Mycena floridula]|nr:hypothetical protein C8J56DRAFT_890427 [Mycena floridula]